MAKLPDKPVKRMHYFDHQFLRAADFTAEQEYHQVLRRLHNSALHTAGIADGLRLDATVGRSTLTVTRGVAYDGDGREIVLIQDKNDIDVSVAANKTAIIVISFAEQETDATNETGFQGNTRWTESPLVEVLDAAPPDPRRKLILGSVRVDANGNVAAAADNSSATGRIAAGVVAGDLTATSVKAGSASVDTNLSVTGNITVGGQVDGRDVSVDGSNLDQHVANSNNPHRTTAAQVGALPTTGGSVTGNVTVAGLTQLRNSASGGALIATTQPNATQTPNTVTAAVNAVSGVSGVLAMYVRGGAFTGTPAQHAANHALRIDGDVLINGTFRGTKDGYVVDTFINASGLRLRTGDLVRLKGTPVARFTGLDNKIPIPEITLTDQENDSRVIGIIDREVAPSGDMLDRRSEPDDPTFVDDGGEVQVVTLGTYAHCKVDTSGGPIEAGDLLTASANPGYARKATEPKIGSIIGKALEPLGEGTGYIAVFVNMQ
jgi:hypothetical protein